MATSQPHCREQLTAADFDCVAKSLSATPSASLASLFTEPAALAAALDCDRLRKFILESPATLGISPQLYFYVLVRRMLARFDRDVADYIAGVLVSFIKTDQWFHVTGCATPVPYFSDMLIALQSASTEREFQIRVHIGNCSLFFAGVFPQHIQERERHRGAPSIGFYDEVGSTNYRLAANHRLAQQTERADVYRTMADHFTEVRVGLNQMAERLLCLEPTP
ncbi:MAG: hypothetical protein WCS70_15190 [Verrucomicrobiota bacterium]